MTSSNTQIDHYVILLSEHNVAEFKAILQFKPKIVHVLCTKKILSKKTHQKFQEAFNNSELIKNANIKLRFIEEPDNINLIGDRVQEVEHWIKSVFDNYAKKYFKDDERVVLNNTGGTKPISFLMSQAYPWNEIHYCPYLPNENDDFVDILTLDKNSFKYGRSENIHEIFTPLDHIRLYADTIFKLNNPDKITKHANSIQIAELRLQGQFLDKASSTNHFPAITAILERLWISDIYKNLAEEATRNKANKDYTKPKFYKIEWDMFKPYYDNDFDNNSLINFFETLYELDDYMNKNFKYDEQGIDLPTHFNNKATNWKKWISGTWLEQLIHQWLIDFHIAEHKIQVGINPSKESGSGNELDILILDKNNLKFFEVKADIPNRNKLTDTISQVINQSNALGKVDLFLILSKYIYSNREDEIEQFEKNCKEKEIKIIWLENKEQFKQELQRLKII